MLVDAGREGGDFRIAGGPGIERDEGRDTVRRIEIDQRDTQVGQHGRRRADGVAGTRPEQQGSARCEGDDGETRAIHGASPVCWKPAPLEVCEQSSAQTAVVEHIPVDAIVRTVHVWHGRVAYRVQVGGNTSLDRIAIPDSVEAPRARVASH